MKRSLRIVYNEPHMPLEELLIHDQGMGVHHKHQYFINCNLKNIFHGKSLQNDLMYNLRTSNLLTLPKVNTKRFGVYL